MSTYLLLYYTVIVLIFVFWYGYTSYNSKLKYWLVSVFFYWTSTAAGSILVYSGMVSMMHDAGILNDGNYICLLCLWKKMHGLAPGLCLNFRQHMEMAKLVGVPVAVSRVSRMKLAVWITLLLIYI